MWPAPGPPGPPGPGWLLCSQSWAQWITISDGLTETQWQPAQTIRPFIGEFTSDYLLRRNAACQDHNSQCSLECVAQTLSPDTDQCPSEGSILQTPGVSNWDWDVECVHVTISQSEVGIAGKGPMRLGLELRYWLDLSRSLCPGLHSSNLLSANWSESSQASEPEQSQLTTSHIEYFTPRWARRRMDSIKFYCPILPAP